MKNKTYRFAVAAALLLALALVFAAPVGAVDVNNQDQLEDALSGNDDVINIKSKITLSSTVTITRTVTIDGGNYLIDAGNSVGSLFNVDAGSSPTEITVTFKNMNLQNDVASDYRCIATRSGNINLIVEDSVLSSTGNNAQVLLIGKSGSTNLDVDLKNVKITAMNGYPIETFNPITDLDISDSTITGYCALSFQKKSGFTGADGSVVNIRNSTLTSYGKEGETNGYSTIAIRSGAITVNIFDKSKIIAYGEGSDSQSLFNFQNRTFENNQWIDVGGGESSTINVYSGAELTLSGAVTYFAYYSGVYYDGDGKAVALPYTDGSVTQKNNIIVHSGVTSSKMLDSEFLQGRVSVLRGDKWVVEEIKPAFTVTVPGDGNKIDFTGPTCTNFVDTDAVVEVKVKNTGNQFISLAIGYKDVDSCFEYLYPTGDDLNLDPNEELIIKVCPAMQVEAGTYTEDLTISAANILELENVVIPLTFIAVNPTDVNPSINVEMSDDGMTITPRGTTTAVEVAESIVGITATNDMSVLLLITEATVNDDGSVTRNEGSEVIATYMPMNSVTAEDITESVSVAIIIGMGKPDTSTLPTFSGEFYEYVVSAVETENKDYKPLSMITATEKVDKINNNFAENKGSIGIAFTISDDLYQQYKGKFIALHVKDGKVIGTLQVEATKDEDTGYWSLEFYGDSFSSYVLAVDNTPADSEDDNLGGGSSGKDTGSGNYQYYPRDVPTNGIVDFGTSKVVKGMELPAGSSGKVTLNTKPTFAMPVNGFYAFEIDAPGYNLDAKINGGLSFQIPEADLTAAGYTAKDIVLYHGTVAEDEKIIWEALPTNLVKNENGIAYYKSAINGCSPFYIGFVKDGSVVNTEVVDPVTPPTDEPTDVPGEILPEIPPVDEPETPATPVPLFAVLAGLGAAVVLRRK